MMWMNSSHPPLLCVYEGHKKHMEVHFHIVLNFLLQAQQRRMRAIHPHHELLQGIGVPTKKTAWKNMVSTKSYS